jgi:hypothetical protein
MDFIKKVAQGAGRSLRYNKGFKDGTAGRPRAFLDDDDYKTGYEDGRAQADRDTYRKPSQDIPPSFRKRNDEDDDE